MTRKELYSRITSLNFQDEVKAKYGKNYTQVSNAELEAVVKNAEAGMAPASNTAQFNKLVEVLQKKHILLPSEVKYIMA